METTTTARKKRRRLDWEAIERDHRTGRYTLKELAAKHKTSDATIGRKISEDRATDPARWRSDLTEVVRQATNARVMAAMVSAEISTGQQRVSETVSAAAEMGAQVILGHRNELRRTRELAMSLLEEVESQRALAGDPEAIVLLLAGEEPTPQQLAQARQAVMRALGTGSRVSSAKALAETFTKLHAGERTAFGLDEGEKDPDSYDERIKRLHDAEVPPHAAMPPGAEL